MNSDPGAARFSSPPYSIASNQVAEPGGAAKGVLPARNRIPILLRAGSRERDLLRAAGSAVGELERSAASAGDGRFEGHTDGAARAGRQRTPTTVALHKVSRVGRGDRDTGDGDRRRAHVLERHRFDARIG